MLGVSCPALCCAADIDGAYFGATFPHLFLMTYPAVVPQPPVMVYVPRVFGFRIHKEGKRDRDQVSTARQEAADKMEQLSISKRKAAAGAAAAVAGGGGGASTGMPSGRSTPTGSVPVDRVSVDLASATAGKPDRRTPS